MDDVGQPDGSAEDTNPDDHPDPNPDSDPAIHAQLVAEAQLVAQLAAEQAQKSPVYNTPDDTQAQVRAIYRDAGLSMAEKSARVFALLNPLAAQEQKEAEAAAAAAAAGGVDGDHPSMAALRVAATKAAAGGGAGGGAAGGGAAGGGAGGDGDGGGSGALQQEKDVALCVQALNGIREAVEGDKILCDRADIVRLCRVIKEHNVAGWTQDVQVALKETLQAFAGSERAFPRPEHVPASCGHYVRHCDIVANW